MYDGFMKASTTVPITQARPRLTEILDIVKREPVTITKDGAPVAIIVDPEDYAGLLATLEILSNPDLRRQVADFEARRARGDVEWVSQEDVVRLADG
jgi:prevent-host-death family protein